MSWTIPEWIQTTLASQGSLGVLVYVLITIVLALSFTNWHQYKQANKVYGYRLAERDTLTKALTDTTHVISDMLKDAEEDNTLTKELADLLNGQAGELESVRQAVVRIGESVRDNHMMAMDSARAAAQAVAAMAESIRALNSVVMENRIAVTEQLQAVRQCVVISEQAVKNELRQLIGLESTVVIKKRRIAETRPTKRS